MNQKNKPANFVISLHETNNEAYKEIINNLEEINKDGDNLVLQFKVSNSNKIIDLFKAININNPIFHEKEKLKISFKNNDDKVSVLIHGILEAFLNTLLYHAIINHNTKAKELLKNNGADVNSKNECGWTTLHLNARDGKKCNSNNKGILALLEEGADVNAKNNGQYTPLHIATIHENHEAVEHLVRGGADVNAKSSEGKTALDYAKRSQNKQMIELLEKKRSERQAKTSCYITASVTTAAAAFFATGTLKSSTLNIALAVSIITLPTLAVCYFVYKSLDHSKLSPSSDLFNTNVDQQRVSRNATARS